MILEIAMPLLSSVLFPRMPIEEHIEKTAHETRNDVLCSCVSYVRLYRPDIPSKNAHEFRAATSTPFVGAVALMRYPASGVYHLAYVNEVRENTVILMHANVIPCEESVEEMHINNERILGYL